MGSVGIAAWLAKLLFLGLMTAGMVIGGLRARTTVVFLVLGAFAWIGLPRLPRGADFVTSALALVDIALVLVVYKGDVRIG